MKKILFILAAMLLGSVGLHAGTQITYYASAQLENFYLIEGSTTFGPAITSHTFSNGQGTITCAGEITTIGRGAFVNCTGLTQIVIPSSVTTIEEDAFNNSGLTSVIIPSSVTTIEESAFRMCSSLAWVVIPSSVKKIETQVFADCSSLTSVTVAWKNAQSIVPINSYVFEGIANGAGPQGATLYVPVGTIDLYKQANGWNEFGGIVDTDNKITYTASAQLNRTWLSIGAVTFGSPIVAHDFSNGVGTIVCAGPITKIGANAFLDCFGLTSIQIPNTVTAIEMQAFYNCNVLTSIAIPSSVTTIGYNAFRGCSGLTSIVVENGNTKYDSRDNCNAIVETATNTLLYGCQNTIIPNSVTRIGEYAFSGCSGLTSVKIPSSVTMVEAYAFLACSGLTSVEVSWTDARSIAPVGEEAFSLINQGAGPARATLVVPTGTYNLYKQANGWKEFGGIVDTDNKITYTASAQLSKEELNIGATTFGSRIFSHTFSNGIGTIVCDGPITTIGSYAFENCTGLKSIEIPNSVTRIEGYAFENCTGLKSIEIPNSVTRIEGYAFDGCTSLTSVTAFWTDAQSIVSINSSVFQGIANGAGPQGATLYVPEGTANLYKQADGWKDFIIAVPNGIITYTAPAQLDGFEGSLNKGATTFGPAITNHTFSNGIGTIICNGEITTIGSAAFQNCTGLTSVTIPKSVTTIGKDAFNACSGLTKTNYTGTVADWCKIKFADYTANPILYSHNLFINNVEIKNLVIPQNVTTIEDNAFYSCSGFNSVTIGDSVIKIGERAFWGCRGVESLTIPASVKEIGFVAFKNCTKLNLLEFAKREFTNPINIDTYAFENTALTSVVIPDWMKEIPKGLFYKNSQLKAIYLPTSVENINYQSFGECKNLKYIFSVSQTPPALAEGAFEGHDKDANVIVYVPSQDAKVAYQNSNWNKYFTKFVADIEYRIISTSDKTAEVVSAIPFEGTVSIPGTTILDGTYYNVIGIGDRTFEYNDSLTSISLSPTLKYIGNDVFNGCKRLKKVQLPEDLQTIGYYAFYGCSALDSIVIPDGVQILDAYTFYRCKSLTHIVLPAGLRKIWDGCFGQCPLGQEIIVPEGVDTIGKYAFEAGDDTQKEMVITLPSTLEEIKDYAFLNHQGLKEVICLAQEPPTLGVNVFTNTDTAIVYVPNRDVLGTYRDNSLWKNYKFKFDDLMAKTNKAYLYEVAGNNEKAQGIAQQYCDSIDKATTAAQVEFFTNKALALIDPYTLNDYKGRLADTLESIANTCPDSAAKPIALGIAAEYRNKIMSAIFRQDAEKIFAEGLAKINEVFELVELKKTCCNNLRISARGLGEEIETIAEDFCKQINNAITKEEVNKIYKEGSQVIAMYTYIQCYWSGSPDDGCQTTKGYYDKGDK